MACDRSERPVSHRLAWRELPSERAEVAAARDGTVREDDPPARGAFHLWPWRGLTLADLMSGSAHWIGNEGAPADIPPFEGMQIVLLGPPPYERSWNPGRKFPAMADDLFLEPILAPGEESPGENRESGAVLEETALSGEVPTS